MPQTWKMVNICDLLLEHGHYRGRVETQPSQEAREDGRLRLPSRWRHRITCLELSLSLSFSGTAAGTIGLAELLLILFAVGLFLDYVGILVSRRAPSHRRLSAGY